MDLDCCCCGGCCGGYDGCIADAACTCQKVSRCECENCFDYEMDELDQLAGAEPTDAPDAEEE